MRSRMDYIVTKDEVYAEAESWLDKALRLNCSGYIPYPSSSDTSLNVWNRSVINDASFSA